MLLILFLLLVLAAVHPIRLRRRAAKAQAAGAEMLLFGTSAADRAVLGR